MNTPDAPDNHYRRIAEAIDGLIKDSPPSPKSEGENIHRLFIEWAGVSPEKFLQYISAARAKKLIRESQEATLFDAALETGLSDSVRLHSLFINIEEMTPSEHDRGGTNLSVNYSFANSPFGKLLAASTSKGVCSMVFEENEEKGVSRLKSKFPNASFHPQADVFQQNALLIFQSEQSRLPTVKLHLKGTDFQLKVWEALLKIPRGKLSTYGNLAAQIGNPRASRAVGAAIGSNPVAFLIPCHRVIQSSGEYGGYRWGSLRKTLLIGWEGAKTNS